MKLNDLTGQIFGKLTVLRHAGTKNKQTVWTVRCECGTVKTILASNIARTKSCGCENIKMLIIRNTKHGMEKSAEYQAWVDLRRRCTNPRHPAYKNYGARGISVASEWSKSDAFMNFYNHIGPRPGKEYSVDRINNNGNYEPGNVRWATVKEQNNNKRSNKKQS